MTEDDPPPPLKPALVRSSAAWLAEQRAKSVAYDERRRRYTQAWHRRLDGLGDEPEPEEEGPGPARMEAQRPVKRRSRARGRIHNPRQGSLDFDT